MKPTEEHVAVVEHHEGGDSLPPFLNPDVTLMILTWVTFIALLIVLYKYAWKPILEGLDKREASIRNGIEAAEKAQAELAQIDDTCKKMLDDADTEAKRIVDRGRKGAVEAAKVIEHKAKEEAKITLGNATHEIEAKKEKAHMDLRQESVTVAVSLASKIIDENLDDAKQKKFIDKLIKDFQPEDYDEQ